MLRMVRFSHDRAIPVLILPLSEHSVILFPGRRIIRRRLRDSRLLFLCLFVLRGEYFWNNVVLHQQGVKPDESGDGLVARRQVKLGSGPHVVTWNLNGKWRSLHGRE